MALRVIPYEIPGFDELGIPPSVERLVNLPMGLVIVTGPTGSGKSTTLAAMLDYINRRRACHIVTIEDPIEYVHGNHRSAVSQREVGNDTKSFPRPCARPCGRTPTCCWSVRCATWRASPPP